MSWSAFFGLAGKQKWHTGCGSHGNLATLGGKSDERCRVLAEIYESFTEGFETADLRAAKAVLDEWRS